MKKIEGVAKTVREVLKDQRYAIDYYQREYRWQEKQIKELIEDLTEQFLKSYSPGHPRKAVQNYEHYFLGSIVLSSRDSDLFIVDGQQRLTTLTLLLILLHRRQGVRDDRVKLEDLIYAEIFGSRSFNIDVPDRAPVMEAIFKGETPDTSDATESVQTIAARYEDLDEQLPEEFDETALPYFCDWLLENVHLVQITASTDEDAYTIFETMNDRGLSLAPLDMLKGYLLAHITDSQQRAGAANVWRDRVEVLRRLGKEEDADAVKVWLRAKHARTVRDRNLGSENRDFERISTEFHRWVGGNAEDLGLTGSEAFFKFVQRDFNFYTRRYEEVRRAAEAPVAGLEPVYHVARFGFTLQYPLLLAPLRTDDDPDTVKRKVRAVATFLDVLLARRAVNYLSMTVAAMSYAMFLVMKEIRDKPLDELVQILKAKLDEQGCDFDGTDDGSRGGVPKFGLNQWSQRYIKVLLARMTEYVMRESGESVSLPDLLKTGREGYEIEHIWADHPERHADEFESAADFAEQRNRFGDLLLLPKSFNASYGDLPYVDPDAPDKPNRSKREGYLSRNLLARSLNPKCYERHPGFRQFVKESGLPFTPHAEFKRADLDSRTVLYHRLAERIWDPNRLLNVAAQ